ncbi:MAG: GNAT family N-acetyltransferase [Acidobacteriota bacterium]
MTDSSTDNSRARIRRLMPEDASVYREIRLEALQLSSEAFGSSFEYEGAQPLDFFREAVTKADIFGAFLEMALVGVAGYRTQVGAKQAHKGLLWGMYVRPVARGTGAGKSLVKAVLDHAQGRVELVQLTVVADNEAAQRLYRSCGFVAYGHEVHSLKQGGRYYDELLMAVALMP